jgi:hypothetical protein
MRVSSPIGDLPFEPRKLRLRDGGIEMDGVMGAWPAQVQISPADIPAILRLIAKPAAIVAAILTTVVGVATLARPGRRHHQPERNDET